MAKLIQQSRPYIILTIGYLLSILLGIVYLRSLSRLQTRKLIGNNSHFSSLVTWSDLPPSFLHLLQSNQNIFVLESALMIEATKRIALAAGKQHNETNKELQWLKERFNLPDWPQWSGTTLTVGIFADQWEQAKHDMGPFKEIERTTTTRLPFRLEGDLQRTLHVFYQANGSSRLRVHMIVLYHIEHFVWIGTNPLAGDQEDHFSASYEQIFDPFDLERIGGLNFPSDTGHLLSQLPTARYLHCDSERTEQWLHKNGLQANTVLEGLVEQTIISMKALMRHFKMEFWIVEGTLLGWHRACHVIPYDRDFDIATWSRYLNSQNVAEQMRINASSFGLRLYTQFGDPATSHELSFWLRRIDLRQFNYKVDLFFVYDNLQPDQFLLPLHTPHRQSYTYLSFPTYKLCSVALLSYKLLAPCTAEEVVVAEYGDNWNEPLKDYDDDSARNSEEQKVWDLATPQMIQFSLSWWEWLVFLCNF